MTKGYDLITILGPTASGKTALATRLASVLNAEIISADSRQVYRGMDIGTGKDLSEYVVDGRIIPYHLINIADAGESYDLYRFMNDFSRCYSEIRSRGNQPLMCGGSGMYLEAVISGYKLSKQCENKDLEEMLAEKCDEELMVMLSGFKELHNISDTSSRERLIKAILIAMSSHEQPGTGVGAMPETHFVAGIDFSRNVLRERITKRLCSRLEQGLVDEVRLLIDSGIPVEKLRYYGLEYRYVTDYLTGVYTYDQMTELLNTAIHQFAKRQMTWFRRMEKKGVNINWVPGDIDIDLKVEMILNRIE